jgi:hypothetical protein
MSAAAIGAEVLDRWLREGEHRVAGAGRVFQRRLVRATVAAWQLATGADYRFGNAEGPPQDVLARLSGRYFDAVVRAATRRPWVRRRLADVLHLLRPPSALFSPTCWPASRGTASRAISGRRPTAAGPTRRRLSLVVASEWDLGAGG